MAGFTCVPLPEVRNGPLGARPCGFVVLIFNDIALKFTTTPKKGKEFSDRMGPQQNAKM